MENEERKKIGKKPRTENNEYGSEILSLFCDQFDSYGMAADWWSVGVMIYEMIRGQPCFHGDDLKQTYQRVLYGEVRFIPEGKFSEAAKELILGLLNRYKPLHVF